MARPIGAGPRTWELAACRNALEPRVARPTHPLLGNGPRMTGGWLAQRPGQGPLQLGGFFADKDGIALGWGLVEIKTSVHCSLLVVVRGLQQELAWGQASILGTGLTQAGAWDHGLRCLLLDKHLLEQQNSKKL